MKKWLGACLALSLVIGCLLGGCAGDEKALKKVTLSEVTHSVFYAPQYVAMAKGFFAEEGIELDLVNGQGADKVMTAVVSGQADIGLSGPEAAIYVWGEGRDDFAVVFAQLTKRDGSFLLGREPDPDFTWDKLKGSYLIGGRTGGVPAMTLDYVLRSHGLEPNVDLTVDNSIQFALMGGAFTGGTGDYVTLFEPVASAVEAEGKGYILASVGEESGEIPYTAYYASKSYMKENPEIIQGFTNAIYKGQQWCAEHSAQEIAEVIADQFPDNDLELLVTVTQRHKDIDAWNGTPVMTEDAFERLQTVMDQAGELTKPADYSALVDNSYAEKAIKG